MSDFWKNVLTAPWWVYLILMYLLTIGIWSLRPRTITVYRFFIVPSVLCGWSIYTLYLKMLSGLSSQLLPFWGIAFVIGIYLGQRVVRSWHIRVNKAKMQMTLPGNRSTLILLMLVFVAHFVFDSIEDATVHVPYWFQFADVLTSSLIAGLFVGRAWVFLRRFTGC